MLCLATISINSAFREFLRAATKIRPHVVLDAIKSGEALEVKEGVKVPIKSKCKKCDYISSQEYCKACLLLDGLNSGRPLLGIGKSKDGKIKKFKKRTTDESCSNKTDCCNSKPSDVDNSDKMGCAGDIEGLEKLIRKNTLSTEASDLF